MKGYYLGMEVLTSGDVDDGWVWCTFPGERNKKGEARTAWVWAWQVKEEPWALTTT